MCRRVFCGGLPHALPLHGHPRCGQEPPIREGLRGGDTGPRHGLACKFSKLHPQIICLCKDFLVLALLQFSDIAGSSHTQLGEVLGWKSCLTTHQRCLVGIRGDATGTSVSAVDDSFQVRGCCVECSVQKATAGERIASRAKTHDDLFVPERQTLLRRRWLTACGTCCACRCGDCLLLLLVLSPRG